MAKFSDKALVVKKIGMTRMMDSEGRLTAVTLLQVEQQKVTKILTSDKNGYQGFQVGYKEKAEKNLTKADINRLRKSSISENYSKFREFRTEGEPEALELGNQITAEMFKEVSSIDVTGITKGRGFQGAVKRWNASIGRMTHGSRFHRRPGSLGQCTTPGRVYKNKHQPGHMGVDARTVKNVRVMDVDLENNVIAIKGSVPGHRDGWLEIRPTNKR